MSYKNNTPCDSNDIAAYLLDLADDDGLIMDILPCANQTTTSTTELPTTTTTVTVQPTTTSSSTQEVTSISSTILSEATTTEEPIVITLPPVTTTKAASSTTSVQTTSQTKATIGTSDTGDDKDTTTIEEVKEVDSSFYTCHPNPTSLQNGVLQPDGDFVQLDIVYDYELHATEGADVVVSIAAVESRIVKDLAGEYGLVECTGRRLASDRRMSGLRRRSLNVVQRSVEENYYGIVALGSDPEDEVLSDCEYISCDISTLCCVGGILLISSHHFDTRPYLYHR
jgi:hypothetical protein